MNVLKDKLLYAHTHRGPLCLISALNNTNIYIVIYIYFGDQHTTSHAVYAKAGVKTS